MSDLVKRLRKDDDLSARMEAADEIERLYVLAKANNDLVRMYKNENYQLRRLLSGIHHALCHGSDRAIEEAIVATREYSIDNE